MMDPLPEWQTGITIQDCWLAWGCSKPRHSSVENEKRIEGTQGSYLIHFIVFWHLIHNIRKENGFAASSYSACSLSLLLCHHFDSMSKYFNGES